MQVGTLTSLHRYPFKSMAGEDLSACELTSRGLWGDRVFALRDDEVGEIRGGKHWPLLMTCTARHADGTVEITLPAGDRLRADSMELAGRLSALVGSRVSVWPL